MPVSSDLYQMQLVSPLSASSDLRDLLLHSSTESTPQKSNARIAKAASYLESKVCMSVLSEMWKFEVVHKQVGVF